MRLHGLPIGWRTRIVDWQPPHAFVDEQLRGPYRLWRHLHTFDADGEGGTIVRDRVEYRIRGGAGLQALAQRLLVERDLRGIFEYRRASAGGGVRRLPAATAVGAPRARPPTPSPPGR